MGLSRDARRRALAGLATGAAAFAAGCAPGRGPAPSRVAGVGSSAAGAAREWRGDADPFSLGVASGLQGDGGTVVLWTRLAPRPLEPGGGVDPVPVAVRWELRDEAGGAPVASGREVADPAWAHTVRVELGALPPDRAYRYRFASGAASSVEGRFRTPPAAGADARLRIAFASCQQYEHGFYAAWRHAVADAPDLVAFLGDYVYEASWGRDPVRRHEAGVPATLEAWRRRHALYRGDADLQAAHAACAWVMTWDDHEVENDYAAGLSARGEAPDAFGARRAAAYRAWFEHMPLPWSRAPRGASMRVHGHVDWGGLARLHVLDDRQHRSPQACQPPGRAGSRVVGPECAARLEPGRTMLGDAQEAWFARSMGDSRARWNLVVQQTLIGRAARRSGEGGAFWTDGWDGYPAARRRLLEAVEASGARNPFAIGGDVHAFYAGELHADFDRPAARPVMVEFTSGAISSQGWSQASIDALVARNPNLRWGEGRHRGYGLVDLERGRARIALRGLDDVTDPASRVRTLRSFDLHDGRAGLDG